MTAVAWAPYVERYVNGEWRDKIFRDMILRDAGQRASNLTFLDIGCGHGFDNDVPLQQSIADVAGRYIGIEPDPAIELGTYFDQTHRCLLEDAPLAPQSVDIAFAVMVLEHVPSPQGFWDKLYQVLVDGGVFWGLTIDSRHWFTKVSVLTERIKIKDLYLNHLLGRRGAERYENYPVYYRSNNPQSIRHYARRFRSCEFVNFSRVGQCNAYYPRMFHRLADMFDRSDIRRGRPGTLLAVRVQK